MTDTIVPLQAQLNQVHDELRIIAAKIDEHGRAKQAWSRSEETQHIIRVARLEAQLQALLPQTEALENRITEMTNLHRALDRGRRYAATNREFLPDFMEPVEKMVQAAEAALSETLQRAGVLRQGVEAMTRGAVRNPYIIHGTGQRRPTDSFAELAAAAQAEEAITNPPRQVAEKIDLFSQSLSGIAGRQAAELGALHAELVEPVGETSIREAANIGKRALQVTSKAILDRNRTAGKSGSGLSKLMAAVIAFQDQYGAVPEQAGAVAVAAMQWHNELGARHRRLENIAAVLEEDASALLVLDRQQGQLNRLIDTTRSEGSTAETQQAAAQLADQLRVDLDLLFAIDNNRGETTADLGLLGELEIGLVAHLRHNPKYLRQRTTNLLVTAERLQSILAEYPASAASAKVEALAPSPEPSPPGKAQRQTLESTLLAAFERLSAEHPLRRLYELRPGDGERAPAFIERAQASLQALLSARQRFRDRFLRSVGGLGNQAPETTERYEAVVGQIAALEELRALLQLMRETLGPIDAAASSLDDEVRRFRVALQDHNAGPPAKVDRLADQAIELEKRAATLRARLAQALDDLKLLEVHPAAAPQPTLAAEKAAVRRETASDDRGRQGQRGGQTADAEQSPKRSGDLFDASTFADALREMVAAALSRTAAGEISFAAESVAELSNRAFATRLLAAMSTQGVELDLDPLALSIQQAGRGTATGGGHGRQRNLPGIKAPRSIRGWATKIVRHLVLAALWHGTTHNPLLRGKGETIANALVEYAATVLKDLSEAQRKRAKDWAPSQVNNLWKQLLYFEFDTFDPTKHEPYRATHGQTYRTHMASAQRLPEGGYDDSHQRLLQLAEWRINKMLGSLLPDDVADLRLEYLTHESLLGVESPAKRGAQRKRVVLTSARFWFQAQSYLSQLSDADLNHPERWAFNGQVFKGRTVPTEAAERAAGEAAMYISLRQRGLISELYPWLDEHWQEHDGLALRIFGLNFGRKAGSRFGESVTADYHRRLRKQDVSRDPSEMAEAVRRRRSELLKNSLRYAPRSKTHEPRLILAH